MTSTPDDVTITDAFAILSLPLTASSSEIRKSYRTLSLKLHPDKARDVAPEIASARFDRLQKAYEKLSDPNVREELIKKAEAETKRRAKVAQFENERKKMSEDLIARERAQEQRQREKMEKERERWLDVEALKERGRKLRMDEEAKWAAEQQRVVADVAKEAGEEQRRRRRPTPPALGPLDNSVRLLYPTELYSTLSTTLEAFLSRHFGPVVRLQQTPPPPPSSSREKKRKAATDEVTCFATFDSMESAFKCVEQGSDFHLSSIHDEIIDAPILDQIWVEWAAAKDILKARRKKHKEGGQEEDVHEKEEREIKGCKVAEPALVRFWRRFEPHKVDEVLGRTTPAAAEVVNGSPTFHPQPSTSSSTFEADVLKRAMEMSRAKAAAGAASGQA